MAVAVNDYSTFDQQTEQLPNNIDDEGEEYDGTTMENSAPFQLIYNTDIDQAETKPYKILVETIMELPPQSLLPNTSVSFGSGKLISRGFPLISLSF